MNPEFAQMKREIEELKAQVKALSNNATIPFPIEKAFRARLGIKAGLQEQVTDITDDFPSPPLAQAVDEGGTDTYDVMTTPDYVLRVKLGSIYVAVPAFDF